VPRRYRDAHPALRDGFFLDPKARSMGAGRDLYGVRQDGSEFPVEIGLNPVFADEGLCVLAAIVDITERRRIEKTNRQLAAIVESSDDAIIGKTLDGTITIWNHGAEALYGYSAQEMIGRTIDCLMPSDRQEERADILDRIEQGESLDHFDTVRVRRDGTPIDVSLTMSPIKDARDRIVGASMIARDVTEQKRFQHALQRSETRMRRILDSALDAVVSMDEDGAVVDWNPQAEAIFGYRRDEILGRPLHELIILPRHREHHCDGLKHFLETAEGPMLNRRLELSALRKRGEEFPV